MPFPLLIGCQMGGPDVCLLASDEVRIGFNKALKKHVTSTHCSAIDEYAPILRIEGAIAAYGAEGLTRLRFAKAKRYITVDIQVPKAVWQPLDLLKTKTYLARQTKAAVAMCTTRLHREKLDVDEISLFAELDLAVSEFLNG